MKNRRYSFIVTAMLLFFALCTITACSGSGAAIRRGDSLAEQNRWHEAMLEYEEALKEDPENQRLIDRHIKARSKVIESQVSAINEMIASNRLARAEDLLNNAISMNPRSSELNLARREIASAWAKQAEEYLEEDNVDRAVMSHGRASSLDPNAPGVSTAGSKIKSKASESYRRMAHEFIAREMFGAALLYFLRVRDLQPDAQTLDLIVNLRARLMREKVYLVELQRFSSSISDRGLDGQNISSIIIKKLKNMDPPEGCSNFRMLDEGDAPNIVIGGELRTISYENTERRRTESHNYQSGTRQVPNPEWSERETEVKALQMELDRAMAHVSEWVEIVRGHELMVVEAGPLDDMRMLRRQVQQSQAELETVRKKAVEINERLTEARIALNETPTTIEEPVISTKDLQVKQVTRSCIIEAALDAVDMKFGTVEWQNQRFRGIYSTEAEFHEGFAPAKISPIPLRFSENDQTLREKAMENLADSIISEIGSLCIRYRTSLIQEGNAALSRNNIPEASDRYVKALFLDPDGDLEEWDTDGKIRKFLMEEWSFEPASILED